jgi:2-methylcitrate dehydratase PrpD
VTFRSAHDKARMSDAAVLRQRAKVQLVPDAALERFMPRRAGIVEVTLTDGKTLSERVDDVRGTSENPMTREEIVAKARDLITPVLGAAAFGKLADRIFDLERMKSVRELRPLLQRA